MIDEIQGPPCWEGPDVLLRQTSFRALDEPRRFRGPDGQVVEGSLRVRFGEVEARGIALTAAGQARYDALVAEVDRRAGAGRRGDVALQVWSDGLPRTEEELDRQGLGTFTYRPTGTGTGKPDGDVHTLVARGFAVREPIVYEDFLPRSAAGIFQSNLTDAGTRDDAATGTVRDADWLADALGRDVADPLALSAAQRRASLTTLATRLGRDPATIDPE
jgi:uncharacterized glyoxalase superfamily metalloenzyme YdcJ